MTEEHDEPLSEPTEQRRRLAALLVRLREGTGLTQTEFGGRVSLEGGLSQSKVSRLERGAQVPTREQALAWADAAAAGAEQREELAERVDLALTETTDWAEEVRHGVAHKQRRIARAEQTASVVREYVTIVPGLLQTAEYTRRLFQLQAGLQPELFRDVPAALAAWAARQQVLYQAGARFEFVLSETALRWQPGPDHDPSMLAAQLHHIASTSTLKTVRLGVIPFTAPALVCAMHGFVLYGEPGVDEQVEVSIHTATRELRIRDEAQIAVYLDLWERLCATAVFGDEARDLLISRAADLLAG